MGSSGSVWDWKLGAGTPVRTDTSSTGKGVVYRERGFAGTSGATMFWFSAGSTAPLDVDALFRERVEAARRRAAVDRGGRVFLVEDLNAPGKKKKVEEEGAASLERDVKLR